MPKIKRIFLGCKEDRKFEKDLKKISGNIPICRMKIINGKYKVAKENE